MIVVGIAGGSGSGKTTITRKLVQELGSNVSVIHHDNYYKAHNDMTYEERAQLNFDHPDAYDTALLTEDLKKIRRGETITCPVYDFSVHNRSEETETVEPADVVIVEGILLFADKALCEQMDIKIFVDIDADVRIIRRIERDMKSRGRTFESIVEQYFKTVKPMHEAFVEPSKKNADVIIPVGGFNQVAVDMVVERIKTHINEGK